MVNYKICNYVIEFLKHTRRKTLRTRVGGDRHWTGEEKDDVPSETKEWESLPSLYSCLGMAALVKSSAFGPQLKDSTPSQDSVLYLSYCFWPRSSRWT